MNVYEVSTPEENAESLAFMIELRDLATDELLAKKRITTGPRWKLVAIERAIAKRSLETKEK